MGELCICWIKQTNWQNNFTCLSVSFPTRKSLLDETISQYFRAMGWGTFHTPTTYVWQNIALCFLLSQRFLNHGTFLNLFEETVSPRSLAAGVVKTKAHFTPCPSSLHWVSVGWRSKWWRAHQQNSSNQAVKPSTEAFSLQISQTTCWGIWVPFTDLLTDTLWWLRIHG